MVYGCKEMNGATAAVCGLDGEAGKQLAVVDLDGTLLRANSFRLLIRFLIRRLWSRFRYVRLLRLLLLLALRRMRLISHVAMKRPIHAMAADQLSDKDISDFANVLLKHLDSDLLLALHSTGMNLLMATAAPSLYTGKFAAMTGFVGELSTPLPDDGGAYVETRGERKRRLVEDYARLHGLTISMVLTDHDDDLPLLRLPAVSRVLVAPTKSLMDSLRRESLEFTVY